MNETDGAGLAGARVLVVEDEALIADEIEDRLTRLGCVVVGVCDNAASALELAGRERPDLVLMDIRIKGPVDGVDAARRLHESFDLPVVFLTAHSDRATLDRALGTAPFGYLLKPFHEQELVLAMEVALRRIRVERSLRESHITRQAILDSVHEGVIAVDPERRVRYLNAAAERMTGWTLEEALERPLSQVLVLQSELDGLLLPELLPPGDRPQGPVVEARVLARGGRAMVAEVGTRPIRHLDLVLGHAVTLHDIGPQRRAAALEAENRRMQEVARAKGQFLANMSHELRTPLNAVLGFSELMAEGVVAHDSPRHDEYLRLIVSNGRHLLQLINDVLDLSHMQANRMTFHPEPVDVAALVDEVARTMAVQAGERQVLVVCTVTEGLGAVQVDRQRLRQVLFNYLSNAIKFTEPGGRVDVRAHAIDDHRWMLEVEDEGIGIEALDLRALFTEFRRATPTDGRPRPGTGLGLALTRQLVEAQGGQVGASSTPGQGSRFHAVLPRDARRPASEGVSARARRLLLASGDAQTRDRLTRELAGHGVVVDAVPGPGDLRRQGRSTRYDAIAMTLSPPDAPDLGALADVRAGGASALAPVRMFGIDAAPRQIVAHAVVDVLAKPLRRDELRRAIEPVRRHAGAEDVVLVIDDEPDARALMRAALEADGLAVAEAPDGVAGLAMLDLVQPCAVVLDLLMPGMDGLQVLDTMRCDPRWADLPVFVWTALSLTTEEFAQLQRTTSGLVAGTGPDRLADVAKALARWGAAG